MKYCVLLNCLGREESRDVRRIEKMERRRQRKQKSRNEPAELVDTPVTVLVGEADKNITVSITNKAANGASNRSKSHCFE